MQPDTVLALHRFLQRTALELYRTKSVRRGDDERDLQDRIGLGSPKYNSPEVDRGAAGPKRRGVLRSHMAKRLVPRPAFSSGQTFAEFMMVVLPTLGLIFGVVSFAMTIYTYSFLSNAARDDVLYAIVHGAKSTSPVSSDDIQTFVRGEAKGINPSSISVTSCWNPQAPPNQCQTPTGNNAPAKVFGSSVAADSHPFYPFASVTLPLSTSPHILTTPQLTPPPSIFRPPNRLPSR